MGQCTNCTNETAGYKCDMCGSEAENHVADHSCGGERCMPKCTGCNEAQSKCTC